MPKSLDELRAELAAGMDAKKPRDIREERPEDPVPEFTDSDLTPKQPKLPRTAVEAKAKVGLDMDKMKAAKGQQAARASQERRTKKGGKYVLSTDGSDATLLFGKHNGESVSDLAARNDDVRSYLQWIIRCGDFDADLMEICEYQLDLHE